LAGTYFADGSPGRKLEATACRHQPAAEGRLHTAGHLDRDTPLAVAERHIVDRLDQGSHPVVAGGTGLVVPIVAGDVSITLAQYAGKNCIPQHEHRQVPDLVNMTAVGNSELAGHKEVAVDILHTAAVVEAAVVFHNWHDCCTGLVDRMVAAGCIEVVESFADKAVAGT
jgi:hypothetical protein